MTPQQICDSLGQAFGEKLKHRTEFRGETTYAIAASDLREIAKFCRDDLSFDYLLDITSIDNFGEQPRPAALFPACAWRPLRLAAKFHRAALRAFVRISDRRCGCATSIRA